MPPVRPHFAPGDRVFAPWEREWLYPGTVTETDGDEELAEVEFDDGDAGRASFVLLRPIALGPGEFVAVRRDRDVKRYVPATVLSVAGETVRVEYEDGKRDSMEVEYIRVPVAGPLAVGARVFAPGEREWLYPATVGGMVGMVVEVAFDDGDHAQALVPELRPLGLTPGQLVGARRDRSMKRYVRAAVVGVRGETVLVEYDDGEAEDIPMALLRLPVIEA
ncbi:MAG TPA: hypothetical protein VH092_00175 [Urbifossiella sp.]|nr:hypothetical protein [Urbifossiella sp.]